MSEQKELYYDKKHGRFDWSGGRYPVALEAEVSSASHDAPWLAFDGIDPDELCRRWNNHERLVQALQNVLDEGVEIGGNAFEEARALLAELDGEMG